LAQIPQPDPDRRSPLSIHRAGRPHGQATPFQRIGIPEYWIVDLDARAIERWRPSDARPEFLDERLVWHPEGAPLALELELPGLFRDIWGS